MLIKRTFQDKTFLKTFFKIAFPVMIQSLLAFIVTFVDTFMIGAVSNEAVSAVYAVNQAGYIFLIASFGVVGGATIFVQQYNGANDQNRVRQCFRFKFIAIALFLLIFVPLYYFLGDKLVWFYCKSDTNREVIFELGKKYLNLIIISYIIESIASIFSSTLREIGKTKIPLFANACSLIVNVILNALFIYVFFRRDPTKSIQGVALATIAARAIELIILIVICKCKKYEFSHKVFLNFHIEKPLFKNVVSKSIPLFFNELFWSGGQVLMTLALSQRNGVLSALSIVSTMANIFSIVFQGLAIGIGVMVGHKLGANKLEEAQENNKKLYCLGLTISIFISVLMISFSSVIPLLFKEVDVTQKVLASKLIKIYGVLLPSFCLCTCFYSTLKSGGMALQTFLLDFISMWFVTIPVAWILASATNMNIVFLYLCVQSTDLVKACIGFHFIRSKKWVKNLTLMTN